MTMLVPTGAIWPFILVLVRLTGLAALAPVFSSEMIPRKVRVVIIVMLSAFIAASLQKQPFPAVPEAMLAIGSEFIMGLVLGFGFRLTLVALSMAGEMMGLQMGLGAASLIDRSAGMGSPLLANFYGLCFTLIFLTIDGHHWMLRILVESFHTTPAGHAGLPPIILVLQQTGETLALGCRLSAPIIIPLMLITIASGFISRAFPQANIMSVSYAVSVLTGISLMAAGVAGFRDVVSELIQMAAHHASDILRTMAIPL